MTATGDSTPVKTCTKCGEAKPATAEFFHSKPAGLHGLHSICKPCRGKQSRAWVERNPDRARDIQRDAKRRVRSTEDGRARLSKINKRYYDGNRAAVNAYYRDRRRSDPLFAVKSRYRGLISKAVQRCGFTKRSTAMEILGCDWETFKNHIERQFLPGMSWDRLHEIHIDHIVPLATAETEEDVIRLNHYTNLRPLWAKDNLRKGARIAHLI